MTSMKRCALRRLGSAAALVVALGVAPATFAGPVGTPGADLAPAPAGSGQGAMLDHLTDLAFPVHLGFGVTPLRSQFGLPPAATSGAFGGESEHALDADSHGTALSFDLKLAWPGTARMGALEPYVALGPALFVIEPDYAGRLLSTRIDPTLQVGAKAGAGVNWRVGKRVTLFGAYEVMTAAPGGLSSGGGNASDPGFTGYDFTYGLRFRY
jgi:hypothetical protein